MWLGAALDDCQAAPIRRVNSIAQAMFPLHHLVTPAELRE
jgi:hypothetical protein